MALADKELPEGVDPDRTITHSVYCGNCGYNLRYGTYVGVCNECGHPYNARPLAMKNIFMPYLIRFPFGDVFLAVVCGAIAFFALRAGLRPADASLLWLAVITGALAMAYGGLAVGRLARYVRYRRVFRRIRKEEW